MTTASDFGDSRDGMSADQRMTRPPLPSPRGDRGTTGPSLKKILRPSIAGLAVLPLGAMSLGTELRQDGYAVRPTQAFSMARMDLFRGTRAGAVSASPGAPRFLSAALVDRPGQDAAAMLISVVDGSFQPTPAMRDE